VLRADVGHNGGVPETTANAERTRRGREAERRREAVTVLRITECTARYAASRLADGVGPDEARRVALEVAAELSAAAASLRRLTRLGPGERRELAVELAGLGVPARSIASHLRVSERAVSAYLNGRGLRGALAAARRAGLAAGSGGRHARDRELAHRLGRLRHR
jgi:hypothetical protein